MKYLILVCCLAAVAWAKKDDEVPGLKHFDKDSFSEDFKEYRFGCERDIEKCFKSVHKHAVKCIAQTMKEKGEKVRECQENSDIAESNRAWQEASHDWHEAIDKCIKGDPFTESRKKRSPQVGTGDHVHHSSSHGDNPRSRESHSSEQRRRVQEKTHTKRDGTHAHEHDHDEEHGHSATSEECWKAMKEHGERCKAKALSCESYRICTGQGEEPEDATKRQWWSHIKGVEQDKKKKVENHVRLFLQCLKDDTAADDE